MNTKCGIYFDEVEFGMFKNYLEVKQDRAAETESRSVAARKSGVALTAVSMLAALTVSAPLYSAENALEEIVVTAQKREQSLQDVSLSITVLSDSDINNLKIQTPADIASFTPGLFVTTGNSGNPLFAMRGIGMNNGESNQNPAVTPYIDEVALPSNAMLDFQLFDLQRIEVLKGPQGTFYGRNVTGGAINFVTKKPTQEFEATASVDYGRFDLMEFDGAIGGGITDTFSVRLAANSVTRDGWQTLILGPDAGDVDSSNGAIDRQGVRGSALWTPSDTFEWLFVADISNSDSEVLGYKHAGNLLHDRSGLCSYAATGIRNDAECASFAIRRDAVGGNPVTGDVELVADTNPDPYTVFGSFSYGNIDQVDSWGLNSTMNWSLGRTVLTSVTGHRKLDRATGADNGSPFIVSDTWREQDINLLTQELRLASDDSWGGLTWLLGVYYSRDVVEDFVLFNFRDHTSFSGLFDSTFYQRTKDLAAFAHVEYQLNDAWKLIGGLRYTDEDRLFRYSGHIQGSGPVPVAAFEDETGASETTGKIGVDFTPNENTLFYGSISRGFKGPGFPATIAFSTPQLAPFNSEELLAYEAGFKSTLADGRVQLNAAAYYYDWTDMQATTAVDREGIRLIVLANAGDVEVKGLEVEAMWAATDELSLRAGVNLMDSEIVSGEFKGDTTVQTPKFSSSLVALYESMTPVAGVLPFVMADYSYRSKVELALANNPAEFQESYGLVGLRAGVKSPDETWEFSAWVRNLADKRYKASSFGAGSGFLPGRIVYAEPRMYGVTLRYNY